MIYHGVFQIPLLTHIFSQKVFKVSQHLRQVFLVHDHFHVVVLFLGLSVGKMLESWKNWVEQYMGVSKNRGTPWMVYDGKPY